MEVGERRSVTKWIVQGQVEDHIDGRKRCARRQKARQVSGVYVPVESDMVYMSVVRGNEM